MVGNPASLETAKQNKLFQQKLNLKLDATKIFIILSRGLSFQLANFHKTVKSYFSHHLFSH